MPLISVIMSTRNGEKTLLESIESILNQSISNLELIICDDASTDNTLELLKQAQQKDSRIVIIHNETNLGLSRSLNKCLKQSTGEYIARMDDDDYSFENRFEKQIEVLEKHPEYAFVGTGCICFNGIEEGDMRNFPEIPNTKNLIKGSPYLHPSVMFRREAIMSVGGYSEKPYAIRRAQDYELFMRMASQNLCGYNMQEPLIRYFYRQQLGQKKRSVRTVIDGIQIRYNGYRQLRVKPWIYIFVFIPVYVYIKQGIISFFKTAKKI